MRKMASAIMPFTIERLHSISCQDAVAAELTLHKKFSSKRVKGEWFKLSRADIEQIKAIHNL